MEVRELALDWSSAAAAYAARAAPGVPEICRLWTLHASDRAVAILDRDGIIRAWSRSAGELTGFDDSATIGQPATCLYGASDQSAGVPGRALAVATGTGRYEGECWQLHRDGSQFRAGEVVEAVRAANGALIGFVRTVCRAAHSAASDDPDGRIGEYLKLAVAHMPQGICQYDADERLRLCNPRYSEILGVDPALARPGATFTAILHAAFAGPGENNVAEKVRRIRAARLTTTSSDAPKEIMLRGHVIAISQCELPDGGWVSTLDDVTERRVAEKQLAHLARHDTLTGLANRATFLERLHAMLSFGPTSPKFALLTIDLDRFKLVNDKLGHPVGDVVLQEVAERMRTQLAGQDLPARLGGDEFAILADCADAAQALELAARLVTEITRPITAKGVHASVGASIGIAMAPLHGPEPDVLLGNADLALYCAKTAGRGCTRVYEPALELLSQQRCEMERDLRAAQLMERFVLHYQPVVDIERGAVTAFEALLRWDCPSRGRVPPADFIPFAEEIGLMPEISDWVLRAACQEAMLWPQDVKVSVNLSPMQFRQPDLVDRVAAALALAGLPPERLELEITETAMIDDVAAASVTLRQLRALGIFIALDDFGTGYSSLSFVRTLPFTRIKIDRSFVQDLGSKPEAAAIVRAVVVLCRSLGVAATAEGVETHRQLELLRAEGCSELQGFWIGRPCPPSELEGWMAGFACHSAARIGPEPVDRGRAMPVAGTGV